MYISIIFLPLLASLFATNRYCGHIAGPRLSVLCLMVGAIFSILIFYEVGLAGSPVDVSINPWIDLGNLLIDWNLHYDTLTASKYLPIVIISFVIQIYSLEYKGHDPHVSRFFSILSLFAVTMLILVTGQNLLILILGWEGVGIVSYLLVNFWYTRIAANKGAMKALFLNKIGDMFFIFALILGVAIFSDLSLATIFATVQHLNGDIVFIFTLFIIIAASAKSALIGFTPWLSDAKEGPTSVSALLHSSTKVTAGVYLLMRISPLLELSSTALVIVVWLGSLGALFGAMCGLVNNDIKKIIAFSTMSQLGYKVVAVGVSLSNLALFHLMLHAFFKSLLFLSSGAILHAVLDNQNINKKGSLHLFLPFTYLVFFFASLSLKAFPFTSGFYSKDLLIELLCVPHNFTASFAYLFTLFGALITATYSLRILKIAMFSRPLFPLSMLPFVVDSPKLKTYPLIFLSFFAVMLGYFSHELFLAYGSTFYLNSIFTSPHSSSFLLEASFAASSLALIPLLFFTLFLLILFIAPLSNSTNNSFSFDSESSIELSSTNYSTDYLLDNPKANYNLTTHFTLLNYFNVFYHWVKYFGFLTSHYLFRYIDKGFLEFFGPNGSLSFFHYIGYIISNFSTGYIPHYASVLILSISLFLIVL